MRLRVAGGPLMARAQHMPGEFVEGRHRGAPTEFPTSTAAIAIPPAGSCRLCPLKREMAAIATAAMMKR